MISLRSPGVLSRGFRLRGVLRRVVRWPPGARTKAVLAAVVYRWLLGLALVLPLSGPLSLAVRQQPVGDRLWWRPGGVWLIESLRLGLPACGAVAPALWLVLLIGGFAWLLPLGALVVSWAPTRPPRRYRWALGRAAGRLPSLALMQGACWLGAALGCSLLVFGGRALSSWSGPDSRAGDVLGLATMLASLTLVWLFTVGHDLWRVVVLRRHVTLGAAARSALALLRHHPTAVLGAAGWRTVVALGCVVLGTAAGWRLAGGQGGALVAAVLLQQLPVGVLVLLRASWFAWVGGQLDHDGVISSALSTGASGSSVVESTPP